MREDVKRMKNLGIPDAWQPEKSYNQRWLFEHLKPDEDGFMAV